MKGYLKYSLSIPVFAAVFLLAVTALPAQEQPADAYARTVMVHITSDENHRVLMGVQHAKAMLDSGKNVAVLLDVDGVKAGVNQPDSNLSASNDLLQQFLADGGRVIACQHCVGMAGFSMSDMLPGVEIDSHPNMPKMQRLIDSGAVILDY
ncbi:DsrE family protein [Nitrosopumilus maritimus]|uniref:Uncharacterized protein n=1 Tax=Nitrosopumilus maritimus (strain SCM1) TaxID=436308 RepID=A9A1J4_NITMS|nr:DsrE family protein [Nitrosopumilus maritimus]ABX13173.1 hypothetical protein Nmar_1277 [Nitrosopumilus maritimus SCM1]